MSTESVNQNKEIATADMSDDLYPVTYGIQSFRGDGKNGDFVDYEVSVEEGMVVLDAILSIQEHQDPELAVRWNCKSGRCGSCGMEINGMPKLACMTRISDYDPNNGPITITPMKTFPVIKDLVSDVSWNYEVNKTIEPFSPDKDSKFVFQQEDIERSREFRKCIECFLCQDVCHVLREHDKKDSFGGPRFFVRSAALHFHPEDTADRKEWLKDGQGGIGQCNITRCCTDVCPENISITDNAIIPQKEYVIDNYYSISGLIKKILKR